MEEIVIVGAGIGGLATALALHRLGLKSLVLESSDCLRASGFAMAMWSNAWKALDVIGVGDSLRQQYTQILEMVWLSTNSGHAISRTSLNSKRKCGSYEARFVDRKAILEAIVKELPNDAIIFSTKVVSIEDLGYFKMLHLANGATLTTKTEKGLKGNQQMMKQFVINNLERVHSGILEIIEKTNTEDVLFSPLSLRPPWEFLRGKISKDNVCVVGDAFHPMTPDLGQGGCSSLEDAIVLAKYIGQAMLHGNIKTNKIQLQDHVLIKIALCKYAQERRWRVIELITTSFIIGYIQQSCGKLMSLLRERFMASFLAEVMVKKGDHDCGQLKCNTE